MDTYIKEMSTHGGIYIILNILDCKAYVGQAKEFNKRSHIENLEKGTDNSNLQNDYDNKDSSPEFVYFVAADADKKPDKIILDKYEKLYMTLMEDLEFTLYNTNIQRKDRTLDKLSLNNDEYSKALHSLENDFFIRFKIGPRELVNSDTATRKNALEYYVEQRLNRHSELLDLFASDRFLFNRERIEHIIGTKEKSLIDFDLDEIIISKAGSYVGEGLDQILSYKSETINKYEYCLWSFANNALSVQKIRNRCHLRSSQGKENYVLFSYTPSAVYASTQSYRHPYLKKTDAKSLSSEELDYLKFTQTDKEKYMIPNDMECTSAGVSSANAFVISEISLIKENIDESKLIETYDAVGKYKNYILDKGGYQRSTKYIQLKEDAKNMDKVKMCIEAKHRSLYFIGKLVAPYIISLNSK